MRGLAISIGLALTLLCATNIDGRGKPVSPNAESPPSVSIRSPKPKEEFGHLWQTLRMMPFYRKYGYDVALPSHKRFHELIEAAPNFRDIDKKELYRIFAKEIYSKKDYNAGLKKVREIRREIQQAIRRFQLLHEQWGFKILPQYDIVLTLYGPGGWFNPKTGRVILTTTPDGKFKRGNPLHTIIHEMVHIGIKESIVDRFDLTHWEKERLVDLLCEIKFADILKGYSMQSKSAAVLDLFVDEDALADLPSAVETYVKNREEIQNKTVEIVVIQEVFQGAQGDTVGLKPGDIIVKYDGERITRSLQLVEEVKAKSNEANLELVAIRNGETKRFVLKGGPLGIRVNQGITLKEELPEEFRQRGP